MATRAHNVVDLKGRQHETREQVLERLFSEHAATLRAFLRMRLGVTEDLEDVVQEVFVRLAKLDNLADRLPAGGNSNRSFIFAVANNLVVDIERRNITRRRYSEEQQAQGQEAEIARQPTPESIVLADQEIHQLKNVILSLKPTWRDAFILNRINRMSYRDTARKMGVTEKQVERFLKSALTRLRKAAMEITGETTVKGVRK